MCCRGVEKGRGAECRGRYLGSRAGSSRLNSTPHFACSANPRSIELPALLLLAALSRSAQGTVHVFSRRLAHHHWRPWLVGPHTEERNLLCLPLLPTETCQFGWHVQSRCEHGTSIRLPDQSAYRSHACTAYCAHMCATTENVCVWASRGRRIESLCTALPTTAERPRVQDGLHGRPSPAMRCFSSEGQDGHKHHMGHLAFSSLFARARLNALDGRSSHLWGRRLSARPLAVGHPFCSAEKRPDPLRLRLPSTQARTDQQTVRSTEYLPVRGRVWVVRAYVHIYVRTYIHTRTRGARTYGFCTYIRPHMHPYLYRHTADLPGDSPVSLLHTSSQHHRLLRPHFAGTCIQFYAAESHPLPAAMFACSHHSGPAEGGRAGSG